MAVHADNRAQFHAMHTYDSALERRSRRRFSVCALVETDKGTGITRDISTSGLYLTTEAQLEPGMSLSLWLSIPDGDSSRSFRLRQRGTVIRVEDLNDVRGAGIAFDQEDLDLVFEQRDAPLGSPQ
jgi:hypothetical protein